MYSFPLMYKCCCFLTWHNFSFKLEFSDLPETIHIIHGMMEARLGEIALRGGAQDVEIVLLLRFSLEAVWLGGGN